MNPPRRCLSVLRWVLMTIEHEVGYPSMIAAKKLDYLRSNVIQTRDLDWPGVRDSLKSLDVILWPLVACITTAEFIMS